MEGAGWRGAPWCCCRWHAPNPHPNPDPDPNPSPTPTPTPTPNLGVVEDGAPLLDRRDDRREVVVREHHVRRRLGHRRARAHRDADVGLLERRARVRARARARARVRARIRVRGRVRVGVGVGVRARVRVGVGVGVRVGSAFLSAGASLTPSPVMATTWPCCCSSSTRRSLGEGEG